MLRAWLTASVAALWALASPAQATDISELWNFADPAASERVFRDRLASASGDFRLELLTQIARTYGLRRRFDDAHKLLDEIEPQLKEGGPAPRVRMLLERGRTLRSSGKPEVARPLFVNAWNLAQASRLEGLAVDAAHMVALVEPKTEDQLAWNQRALALAERSTETYAQSWKGSLYNNIGWTQHDAGRYEEALKSFEAALREQELRTDVAGTRIARWTIARCLRSLQRYAEALKIQRNLEAELTAAQESDGYVFEELAELLELTGKPDDAKQYFRRAADELGKDGRFASDEHARLARLRAKGRT